MGKLYIINPEHDIALAANRWIWTAPRAGRVQRRRLCRLPLLWATSGDLILVPDHPSGPCVDVLPQGFTPQTLPLVPWGWDRAVVHEYHTLLSYGDKALARQWDEGMAPRLNKIRAVSSREWCSRHLQENVFSCTTFEQIMYVLSRFRRCVLKAPWSSSGRGVQMVRSIGDCTSVLVKWAKSILTHQGCVVVEPFYHNIRDFALEFNALSDGTVAYYGLSLFDTDSRGSYRQNVIASEEEKREMLKPLVSSVTLDGLSRWIRGMMQPVLRNVYTGPFGVDFMVVMDKNGYLDIKVAELNLRMTMGHVSCLQYESRRRAVASSDSADCRAGG